MKRIVAVLLALAVVWPQMILPCSAKAQSCPMTGCANCACSNVCCPSEQAADTAPLAAATENIFSPAQWAAPKATSMLVLPAADFQPPAVTPVEVLPIPTVPLFLRNCAQLI